jgi:hypothetical protein
MRAHICKLASNSTTLNMSVAVIRVLSLTAIAWAHRMLVRAAMRSGSGARRAVDAPTANIDAVSKALCAEQG